MGGPVGGVEVEVWDDRSGCEPSQGGLERGGKKRSWCAFERLGVSDRKGGTIEAVGVIEGVEESAGGNIYRPRSRRYMKEPVCRYTSGES